MDPIGLLFQSGVDAALHSFPHRSDSETQFEMESVYHYDDIVDHSPNSTNSTGAFGHHDRYFSDAFDASFHDRQDYQARLDTPQSFGAYSLDEEFLWDPYAPESVPHSSAQGTYTHFEEFTHSRGTSDIHANISPVASTSQNATPMTRGDSDEEQYSSSDNEEMDSEDERVEHAYLLAKREADKENRRAMQKARAAVAQMQRAQQIQAERLQRWQAAAPPPAQCRLCGQRFNNFTNLAGHVQYVHRVKGGRKAGGRE